MIESLEVTNSQLKQVFARWNAWYRLRRGSAWAIRGLILGLATGLGLALVGLFRHDLPRLEFALVIVGTALSLSLLAGLAGLSWRIDSLKVARFFDLYFGLEERSSTALELMGRVPQIDSSLPQIFQQQSLDTLIFGREVRPRGRFFVRIEKRQIAILTALAVGIGLVFAFGRPLFEAALEKQAVQQAVKEEIAQIEAIREQVQANERLSPAGKEALLKELNQAVEGLQKAETREQAVAVLSSSESELQALTDPQAQAQAEALQNAGNRLLQEGGTQEGDTPLQSFAQNLAEGDAIAAANDLKNLDLGSLSTEQRDSLASQLEAAARVLEDANPQLAGELNSAAQALREGDVQAAGEALSQAAQSLAATGQQIAQSQVAGQAAAQAGEGQGKLIQGSQSAQGSQSQAGTGAGQGSGSGSQSQPGAGQAQGSGGSSPGSGGAGAGQGSSAGGEIQGPEAGSSPIDQNNQPGDGGLTTYEPVYAPQRLGGSSSAEVALPGSGQPGDQVIGEENLAPGAPGESRVPYTEVLPDYTEAMRLAVENGQVPILLRSLVKKYFSSLEP